MSEVSREDLPGYGRMRPILLAVAARYQITENTLLGGGSSMTPVEARGMSMWLVRKLGLRISLGEAAEVLGRSRSNLLRSADCIERERETDTWLRETTDALLAELGGAKP